MPWNGAEIHTYEQPKSWLNTDNMNFSSAAIPDFDTLATELGIRHRREWRACPGN